MTVSSPSVSTRSPDSDPSASLSSVAEVDAYVRQTVRQAHAQVLESVRRDVLAPLRKASAAAHAAHDEACGALEDDADRRAAWDAVTRYRHRTGTGVWEPLEAALRKADVGTPCRENQLSLTEMRAALASPVPKAIERPEADDLYAPSEADSAARRAAKAAVRIARVVRRRIRPSTPAPVQTIPAAHLVRHHARVRLAEAEADLLDGIEQRIASWVAELERTAASWTHSVLEAERLLDTPDFHHENRPGVGRAATVTGDSRPDPSVRVNGGPDVSPERILDSVQTEAKRLDDLLSRGLKLGIDDLERQLSEDTGAAHAELRDDLARGGSLLGPSRSSTPPRRVRKRQEQRREQADAWPAWHRQAPERIALLSALRSLRGTVSATQATLVDAVLAAGISPIQAIHESAAGALTALADRAQTAFEEAGADGAEGLLERLRTLAADGEDAVQDQLLDPLHRLSVRRAMGERVDEQMEALKTALALQPRAFTVHPRPEPDETPIDPRGDAHEVDWRSVTEATLDEWLFDAWRRALRPLGEATESALGRAEEVQQVVQFNLGAAIEEIEDLRARRGRRKTLAPGNATEIDNARELVGDGLRRSVDQMRETASELGGVEQPFVYAIWTANTRAWTNLHDRARSAGRAREHVLRLQTLLAQQFGDLLDGVRTQLRAASVQARRAGRAGRQRAETLVRLGQTAVGVGEVDASAKQETMTALSSVDSELDALPVVYRRLFSFRPIVDPSLLVARDEDLRVVEQHVDQWMRGLANALILTGPPGSGLTSLINVLRKTSLRTARRHTLEITERVATEDDLARRIARALELPLQPSISSSALTTLSDVAGHLNAAPRPDRLRVCTVENLERVFLRTIGGFDLITRLFAFMSETDTRVLWIGTMSSTGWQAVRSSEAAAAGLVVQHELDQFERDELEELILCRHRRSGLRLSFDAPDNGTPPLLARRAQTVEGDEERQALLREAFFDELFGLCGQNVMLALFYWFRAVHLDPDDAEAGILHVRPLRPIRFDYLDALSIEHAFALKALLDHGTLTISELAQVLQIDRSDSRALLESLGNAFLIAPAEALSAPGPMTFASVTGDLPYRIRPLVLHPVSRFLRSRNVIH